MVVSSSSAWAHAVICGDHTTHVCYCHNPFRYAWNERHRTLAERRDPLSRAVLRGLFRRWREWDWIAAQRVDRYLTNSRITQARITSYFGRESRIVYPPVATDRFQPGPVGDHYLVLSELVSHKRIDTAVRAFNALGLPLVVAGDGPDRRRLSPARGTEHQVHRAGHRRPGGAADGELPRIRRDEPGGVRDRGGGGPGRRPAGDRPGRGRAARDGPRGHDRLLLGRRPGRARRGVSRASTQTRGPAGCVDNAARFDTSVFREALPREVDAALRERPSERGEGRMHAGRRPRRAGGPARCTTRAAATGSPRAGACPRVRSAPRAGGARGRQGAAQVASAAGGRRT